MTGRKNFGRTKMMGQICSEKMVSTIPIWLNYYEDNGLNELVRVELLAMSSVTITSYLKTYRKQFLRRKKSGTRRSRKFNNIIPIKNFDQLAANPGYIRTMVRNF